MSLDNVDKKFRNMPAIDSPGTTPDHPNLSNAFQGYSYTTPSHLNNKVPHFQPLLILSYHLEGQNRCFLTAGIHSSVEIVA